MPMVCLLEDQSGSLLSDGYIVLLLVTLVSILLNASASQSK